MDVSIDNLIVVSTVEGSSTGKATAKDAEGASSFQDHLHPAPAKENKKTSQDDAPRSSADQPDDAPPVKAEEEPTGRSEDENATEDEEATETPDGAAKETSENIEADPIELTLTEEAIGDDQPQSDGKNKSNDSEAIPQVEAGKPAEPKVVDTDAANDDGESPDDGKRAEDVDIIPKSESKTEEGDRSKDQQPARPSVADSPTKPPTSKTTQPDEDQPRRATKTDRGPRSEQVESVANTKAPVAVESAGTPITAVLPDTSAEEATKPTRETAKIEPAVQPASQSSQAPESGLSRLPQHLISRGQRAAADPSPPHVDTTRFVQRVAKAVEVAQQRDGHVRLRLHPPELGAIRLEVRVQNNVLSARVEAETTTARSLLVDNLPALRERLAEQGIHIEQFDVDVPQRQAGDHRDAAGEQAERQAQRANSPRHDESGGEDPQPENRSAQRAPLLVDGELNVII